MALQPVVHERVSDPRLDLVFDKDPRNRNYGLDPIGYRKVARRWARSPITDQGQEGACVGHGHTRIAASRCGFGHGEPAPVLGAHAFGWYKAAQQIDEWPGDGYSGTSVRAGGEIGLKQGLYAEYRWAFGIDEALKAITTLGPLVLGIPWYDSMYAPENGWITVSGKVVGGHCIDADYINWRGEYLELPNSWGTDYANNGVAKMKFETLDVLLRAGGEVCIPVPKRALNWRAT